MPTDSHGLMPDAVRRLFDQLMLVNPSVEAYLVEPDGRIAGHAAPEGRLKRERIESTLNNPQVVDLQYDFG